MDKNILIYIFATALPFTTLGYVIGSSVYLKRFRYWHTEYRNLFNRTENLLPPQERGDWSP